MTKNDALILMEQPKSEADLQRNYRRLALKNHPDKGGNAVKFGKLAEAYHRLKGRMGEKSDFCDLFKKQFGM